MRSGFSEGYDVWLKDYGVTFTSSMCWYFELKKLCSRPFHLQLTVVILPGEHDKFF